MNWHVINTGLPCSPLSTITLADCSEREKRIGFLLTEVTVGIDK